MTTDGHVHIVTNTRNLKIVESGSWTGLLSLMNLDLGAGQGPQQVDTHKALVWSLAT